MYFQLYDNNQNCLLKTKKYVRKAKASDNTKKTRLKKDWMTTELIEVGDKRILIKNTDKEKYKNIQ